jgi:hypothetical protein
MTKPRWILHLPTTVTTSQAAVALAVALRRSLAHLPMLDLAEVTLSEEHRQLLRMRVWCGLPLPDGSGPCVLRDGHAGDCKVSE